MKTDYTEGPPRAYLPIVCRIGREFENHFAFREVPIEEAGKKEDQRKATDEREE